MPTKNILAKPQRAPGFEARVRALPHEAGVYIMRDSENRILYIGKAKHLDHRVPTYFRSLRGQVAKVWRMVERVYDFEYIITDSELEALVLENQLIKKHQPQYNIRLKDDKTYPFIKVTVQEDWPRVIVTRQVLKDGARYFGPYRGGGTAYKTIEILDRIFPFRTCDKEITGNDKRPCMEFYTHRCLGPCASLANKKAYDEAIQQVTMFLDGKQDKVVKDLTKEMQTASESLQFERAAVYRDRIKNLSEVNEAQKVFSTASTDQDVIAFAHNDREAIVQVFFIRGGKLLGSEHYPLANAVEADPGEAIGTFIEQFYGDAANVPSNLLLQHDISDAEVIESWLREKRGRKVAISVPRKGEKKALVELAARNAVEALEQMRLTWLNDTQKATASLTELQAALDLPAWPQRIECYDVAHLQGTDTAGAMVVFEQGAKKAKDYRRFQIKTSGNDDFASMREMLMRRFKRAAAERAANLAQPNEDAANWNGWSVLPDLVVIDGGKGQLSSAQSVMAELGLLDVPMISLAKREEEVFLPGKSAPVILSKRSEALFLLQRVRDEAHRFSNSYNKNLGARRAVKSKLDSIAGVGPKRKKALMKQFGTVSGIREASVEQLLEVAGMDKTTALRIKENL